MILKYYTEKCPTKLDENQEIVIGVYDNKLAWFTYESKSEYKSETAMLHNISYVSYVDMFFCDKKVYLLPDRWNDATLKVIENHIYKKLEKLNYELKPVSEVFSFVFDEFRPFKNITNIQKVELFDELFNENVNE